MKTLIVNADDFNTDRERSRGILASARHGILTSTSVLANLAWDEEVLEELLSFSSLACGCHLNLTRGKPITSGESLTNGEGYFYCKEEAWDRALCGEYDLDEVRAEFNAQIESCLVKGLVLDHVDGNNHIHIFPGISEVVGQVLLEQSIKAVRIPFERSVEGRQETTKQDLINRLAKEAQPIFESVSLRWTDAFFGMTYPQLDDVTSVVAFLKNLETGWTELMCHPGYVTKGNNPFSTTARETELQTICSAEVRRAVEESDVVLSTYGEMVKD